MFSFGIVAEKFLKMTFLIAILSVSSFCEVCSAVPWSLSWARCLSVVTA